MSANSFEHPWLSGLFAVPHKQNPVSAEFLVAVAHHSAGLNELLSASMLHEQERSGIAWMGEWMSLPQLTMLAGCSKHTAINVLESVQSIGMQK